MTIFTPYYKYFYKYVKDFPEEVSLRFISDTTETFIDRADYTYEEVWSMAKRFVNYFRDEGLKAGDVIAVDSKPRNAMQFILFLAINMLGGTFLPIDEDKLGISSVEDVGQKKGEKAIRLVLSETKAKAIVTSRFSHILSMCRDSKKTQYDVTNVNVLNIYKCFEEQNCKRYEEKIDIEDIDAKSCWTGDKYIYITYSSGTSSTADFPYSIMRIPHAGFDDWCQNGARKVVHNVQKRLRNKSEGQELKSKYSPASERFSVLNLTKISFDPSAFEYVLFVAIGFAGTLVTVSDKVARSRESLLRLLMDDTLKISAFIGIPSLLREYRFRFEDWQRFKYLWFVMLTGESLINKQINDIFKAKKIVVNGYGPSQSTFGATLGVLSSRERFCKNVAPVGKTWSNNREIIIRNADGKIEYDKYCPVYVSYRRHFGADHYIGPRKNLKDEKDFVIQNDGSVLFNTGDLGFIHQHGKTAASDEYYVVGREKHTSFKINGEMIFAPPIEFVLQQHPAVDTAIVLKKTFIQEQLIAYLYLKKGETLPDISEMTRFLRSRGDFFAQSHFPVLYLKLEQLPLNSNHKLDRGALIKAPIVMQKTKVHLKNKKFIESAILQALSKIADYDSSISQEAIDYNLGLSSIHKTLLFGYFHQHENFSIDQQFMQCDSFHDLAKYLGQRYHETSISRQYQGDKKSSNASVGSVFVIPGITGLASVDYMEFAKLCCPDPAKQVRFLEDPRVFAEVDLTQDQLAQHYLNQILQQAGGTEPITIIAYSFGCQIANIICKLVNQAQSGAGSISIGSMVLLDGCVPMVNHTLKQNGVAVQSLFEDLGMILRRVYGKKIINKIQPLIDAKNQTHTVNSVDIKSHCEKIFKTISQHFKLTYKRGSESQQKIRQLKLILANVQSSFDSKPEPSLNHQNVTVIMTENTLSKLKMRKKLLHTEYSVETLGWESVQQNEETVFKEFKGGHFDFFNLKEVIGFISKRLKGASSSLCKPISRSTSMSGLIKPSSPGRLAMRLSPMIHSNYYQDDDSVNKGRPSKANKMP